MFTLGADFSHMFATEIYTFFDNYVEVINNHTNGRKFKFFYSTLNEYLVAINKEKEQKNFEWPVYKSDFFPYNGFFPGHYWTGYFTSRPNLKKYIREFTAYTYLSNTFYTFQIMEDADYDKGYQISDLALHIKLLNEKLGEMMHHDTITGTSPNHVINSEVAMI